MRIRHVRLECKNETLLAVLRRLRDPRLWRNGRSRGPLPVVCAERRGADSTGVRADGACCRLKRQGAKVAKLAKERFLPARPWASCATSGLEAVSGSVRASLAVRPRTGRALARPAKGAAVPRAGCRPSAAAADREDCLL